MLSRTSRLAFLLLAATGCTSAMAVPSIFPIVGTSFKLSSDGAYMSAAYNGATKFSFLPSLSVTNLGGTGSAGISNDGTIVGGQVNNSGANGMAAGLSIAARNVNGAWTELPLVPNASFSSGTICTAYDMSGNGRFIVGLAYAGRSYPFIYDAVSNTNITLGATGGSAGGARANAVNDDGTVVAGFDSSTTGGRRPAVWEYDSVNSVWVETVLDETGYEIYAVSPDGTKLAGWNFETPTAGHASGAMWTKVSLGVWTVQQIPAPATLPSWAGTLPYAYNTPAAVSNSGTVVGSMLYGDPFFGSQTGGFIWTAAGGTIDFKDYLTSLGTPGLSSYTASLGGIQAVSDNGNVFAGAASGIGGGAWVVDLTGVLQGPTTPVITLQPVSNLSISLCQSIILNCVGIGSGTLTYQWYKDNVALTNVTTSWGSVIAGATTNQLRITKQRPQDVGTYYCRITNASGTTQSNNVVAVLDPVNPPPTNDTCATAIDVNEGNFTTNICQAWINEGTASCVTGTIGDVWYRYTPTFTGEARIETCLSNYDTVVSCFNACGGTEIANSCNDNVSFGNGSGPPCSFSSASRLSRLPVTANTPIIIRIACKSTSTPSGTMTLSIYQAPARPANDLCANATPATPGLNHWDTNEATTDAASISSCRTAASNDVWFSYTPEHDGKLSVSTCGFTTVNTVLSIHTACPATSANQIACNDTGATTGCSTQAQILNQPVSAFNTYYIRVAGNSATIVGSGEMNLDFVPTPCYADIVAVGGNPPADGLLTGDDFVAFTNAFAEGNTLADICGIGGPPSAPDGLLTGDDFVAFINSFASGCP